MASTEQHTGVRFPWVRTAQPADAEPGAESSEAIAPQADEPAEGGGPLDGAEVAAHHESPNGGSPDGHPAAWPSADFAAASSQAPAATHRPSRFLGELVRAMLAAAQETRSTAIEQVHADAKTQIELIHARSADRAADLKRQADDDNAATREWSKAEMARIREETEQRIAARKEALAADLERHAARIEAEIDQVQKRVAAFEQEVEAFFARLADASDPSQLAALAEQMPDPPQFDDAAIATSDALLEWAGSAGPTTEPEAAAARPDAAEDQAAPPTAADAAEDQAAPPTAADAAEVEEPRAEAEPAVASEQPQAEVSGAAPEQPEVEAEVSGAAPEQPEVEAEVAGATLEQPEAEIADAVEEAPDETSAEAVTAAEAATEEVTSAADAERLATVEAAESDDAAAEAEHAGDDTTATPEDDAGPAARLADLMNALPRPGQMGGGQNAGESAGPSVNSIVTVVGLVSVAGIASFKRQLSHVPGVFSVGVSSSPDGEFVFRVAHDPVVLLHDVVPTLPGFAARVIKESDGRLSVSAHDPANEA